MNENDIGQLCKGTPTIGVLDNRGLAVRDIQFNRTKIGDELDTRISRHTYNAAGHLQTHIDPRFFNILQEQGNKALVQSNFTYTTGLAGQPLCIDSIDAGSRITLNDITGAPHLEWDGDKTLRRFEYDADLHRPVAVTEQVSDEAVQITERFVYGDNADTDTADKNLIGQLVRHYDNAGLGAINSISLTGQPLSETRQLLSLDKGDSDWQGQNDIAWQAPLDSEKYETTWTYNALGILLTQKDAKDNLQRSEYDISGNLTASYLTQSEKDEQPIVSGLEYNARGQKVKEIAGNGVVTEYTYDEKTSRLSEVKTTRPNDVSPLQDLRYSYDPVGNILAITDQTSATRFYKNQKVSAKNAYEYDALYQLTKATGRENATNNAQNSSLPILNIPIDSHQLRNYSRTYGYDRGGNLEQIQHSPNGATGYTTKMVVSDRSNRAVKQNNQPSITLSDVDSHFDVHGNLNKLESNKDLVWGRRDQLKQVNITEQQQEHYQYTVQGQRIRKTLYDKGNNQQEQVIYLPGLEIRRKYNTAKSADTVTEDLHVLTLGQAGRAQVRLQHWEAGKPANEKDIPNNQLRYSLDNHLGSSNLELNQDAEIISQEEYYPFGGTAVWSAKSEAEAKYKTVRYSGKERDATGLYYYGYRYYASWMGRWLNPDPAWTIDGLNLYRMVRNNPVILRDVDGRAPVTAIEIYDKYKEQYTSDSRILPFDMMEDITNKQIPFKIDKLEDKHLEKDNIKQKKFTLRHYTESTEGEPTFNTLSPMFDLVHRSIKTLPGSSKTQSGNTTSDDWTRLGNTGFTFFLLSIDGNVNNRGFLKSSTHYAEIDLDNPEELKELGIEDSEFFATPDLLHEKDLTKISAAKGKLTDLKGILLKMSGSKPLHIGVSQSDTLLNKIDSAFSNTLEIKIPGAVKVNCWNKVGPAQRQ